MGWKIYCMVMAVFLAWAYALLILVGPSIYDWLDMPVSLVSLLGAFGYAFKRAWIGRTFWRCWLFISLGWDFFYNVVVTQFLGEAQPVVDFHTVTPAEIAVNVALLVPLYVALCLYGFRSGSLWSPAPHDPASG